MNKKILLIFSLLLFPLYFFAQSNNGQTFTIEELKRPDNLLGEQNSNDVASKIAPLQLVHSKLPLQIVYTGNHPFFDGMYTAYSEHRPFVLSPDMIWLLICQGFSHHINNNAADLRDMFVNFQGKKSLVVKLEERKKLNNIATWEAVIPQFVEQVSENTSKELITNLTPTFSTTTPIERIATQITALESMHAYFEYIVIRVMCGIPEITIKGTPQDWILLKEKTDCLRKYKLGWWIDELDPLLEQFINASEGNFDKEHWRNMFKYHTEKEYGAPKIIDGWIIKFFPYDKKGKRNDFKMLRSSEDIPDEQAFVDFKRIDLYPDGHTEAFPMQFVAGFYGLKQNHKTQALEPVIGWLVSQKDTSALYTERIAMEVQYGMTVNIRVSEVPKEILNNPAINSLNIEFIDSIKIPAELSLLDLSYLSLKGKFNRSEINKLNWLFPNAIIIVRDNNDSAIWRNINSKEFGMPWDSISYSIDKISEEHWKYASIYLDDSSKNLPEQFKSKKIERLDIQCFDITAENKQKIIDQFPETFLEINNIRIQNRKYFQDIEDRKIRYKKWITENMDVNNR